MIYRSIVINKLKNYWFNISDKIRFLIIGGFNASISYIIFSIICLVIGENLYQTSLAISWIISSLISFTTQKCFVFPIKGNIFKVELTFNPNNFSQNTMC